MTLKEILISQAVIQLPLNVPHPTPLQCELSGFEMSDDFKFLKNLPFSNFYCYNLNKKEKFKLGELSDIFTRKELYFYGICMCFDQLIFMLLSLDSVTYCILESLEKSITIISQRY